MNILLEIILFVIGFLFGIWYFSTVVLSLVYGFPRSLIGYFKKELRLKIAFIYLAIFFGWQIGIIIFFTLIAILFPSFFNLLYKSAGLSLGSLIGFWFSIFRAIFSEETRRDMTEDFSDFTKPYMRNKKS